MCATTMDPRSYAESSRILPLLVLSDVYLTSSVISHEHRNDFASLLMKEDEHLGIRVQFLVDLTTDVEEPATDFNEVALSSPVAYSCFFLSE